MRKPIVTLSVFATCVLGATRALSADRLFAAPDAAVATTSSTGSLTQGAWALVAVLGLAFFTAWLLKRVRMQRGVARGAHIEILAQAALGPKERAVLLQVPGARVLVGVASGHVSALHVTPIDASETASIASGQGPEANSPDAIPTFKSLLKRSLGMP